MTQPVMALLTDFGTSDPYVGVMKGVVLARCPEVRLVDLTHDVHPQNIRQAAYLLRSAYRYFPPHTVFLVVVDPGVGTDRSPIALQTDHGTFVGPDNGVFSGVLEDADSWQGVVLWPPERLSETFHGRDLFAPVAAEIACGASLSMVGSPTNDLLHLPLLRAERTAPNTLEGEVIHIDHFGNIVTSLGYFDWRGDKSKLVLSWKPPIEFAAVTAQIQLKNGQVNGIQPTYSSLQAGHLMAIINSDRHLEIAINRGNAARLLDARIGDVVQLHFSARST